MTDAVRSPRSLRSEPDACMAVRGRMAAALLPPTPPITLGQVELLPHQRQAAARLLRIMARHHGALLADVVGLGKTFTALAVANRYRQAHVLAPAGLIPMWQSALLRTAQRHVTVHSLHRASVRPLTAFADPQSTHDRPLVIIDEAHALRNRATARYHHVASAVSGCDVLLLTATPLHNSPRDVDALLALFLGQRGNPRRSQTLAALTVRREALPAAAHVFASGATLPPPIRRHAAASMPQDRGTLERVLALPSPLPARDGAVAGALIRLGLLRAWCSSDAALSQAVAIRLQRGAAMRDALEAGRHPSGQELAAWVIDDRDGYDMQLGFASLLVQHTTPSDDRASMLATLAAHCAALRALRDHHATTCRADTVRAAFLRQVCETHRGVPVVAFSQHARTVQALFRALSDIAGVGLLTSRQARIASGPIPRQELLGYFAPRAHGRPPPPPARHVTLLLTTDLVSEGVNLQDAGVVVHLDLPWTHARREQRTGRVARLTSPHAEVHEYRLRPALAARQVLRLEARLAGKARLARQLVGDASLVAPPTPTPSASGPRARPRSRNAVSRRTAWYERLEEWAASAAPLAAHNAREAWDANGRCTGALVLLRKARVPNTARLLAVVLRPAGVPWVSAHPDAVDALAHGRWPRRCPRPSASGASAGGASAAGASAAGASAANTPVPHALRDTVTRAVQRYLRHEELRRAVGLIGPSDFSMADVGAAPVAAAAPGSPAPCDSSCAFTPLQQRAQAWLVTHLSRWPAVVRHRHREVVARARAVVTAVRGAAAEEALRQWIEARYDRTEDALAAWARHPVLARTPHAVTSPPSAETPRVAGRDDRSGRRAMWRVDCRLFVGPGWGEADRGC